jgi:PKD repeat protein
VIADDRLPTGIGPGAPIYFVVTPSTVNICLTSSSCANGGSSSSGFCSYHSNFTTSNGGQVIYAAIPFAPELPDVGGAKGCQADGTSAPQYPNGDFADTIVDDLSHESNESITDPLPYSGWYDPTTGNEAADNCETYGDPSDPADGVDLDAYEPVLGGNATPPIDGTYGSLFDQSINGEHYYTQTFWSDGAAGCEAFVPLARVSPAFAAPSGAQVGTTVTFDPAASSAADGLSSATWSYGDGTSAFQVGSPEAATHTYTEPGSYTVTLTTVDADGDVAEVSHRIGIGLAPTASLRYAPRKPYAGGRVSFDGEVSTEPNAGARIDAYTWRFGDGATGTGARPHHVYRRPGAYEVTVGIRDTLGLAATSTAVLHVVSPGRIKAISTSHRDGGRVVVVVKVTAAGTIRIGARSVKLERAGRARFTLEPKGRAGRTRSITVKYRPRVGPKVSRRIRVRSRAIASRR